jgi:hypothetical protein
VRREASLEPFSDALAAFAADVAADLLHFLPLKLPSLLTPRIPFSSLFLNLAGLVVSSNKY